MNKPGLERHAAAMADAIGLTLCRFRTSHGVCTDCGATTGQQHQQDCAVWPIITARGSFRMEQEK